MEIFRQFSNSDLAGVLLDEIRRTTTRKWTIMEVCGGQTHAIMQYGLDQLLPEEIELVHGPGCPVCVTPLEQIDKAITIASQKNVIFSSYGDMLRVPGSSQDLFSVRANGGNIKIVYSPLDAVRLAQENPDKQIVFFAIGFETTAPANATSVLQAKALGLKNFSVLVSHVTVPPAMNAILSSSQCRVQGFLAAGHVCAVMGYWQYHSICEDFKVPIVVTGFEPIDMLKGIQMTVAQLECGISKVENAYNRVVSEKGNLAAQAIINKVFQLCDRQWRGIGNIPMSGMCLRPDYSDFDAENRFQVRHIQSRESSICIAGQILQGLKKPIDCPAFGSPCTPARPLGATMVSSEGTCAAYYRYGRSNEL